MNGLLKLLLDTDTLSLYIRQSPKVVAEAQNICHNTAFLRFRLSRGLKFCAE